MFKFVVVVVVVVVVFAIIGFAAAVDGDAHAEIKSYKNEIEPDGSFAYAFETSNGIAAQEAGNEHEAHGSYEFVSHEGHPFKIAYDADKLGYYPKGEHLPPQLLRALEYLRAHPAESAAGETKTRYQAVAVGKRTY